MTRQPSSSAPKIHGRCATCGASFAGTTAQQVSDKLWEHDEIDHRQSSLTLVTQLPAVTFHRQALDAILTLAQTGREFTIGDAHELVTIPPANPRTDWPKATREAQDRGWITHTGRYTKSAVTRTKGSAVAIWTGTAEARKGRAA